MQCDVLVAGGGMAGVAAALTAAEAGAEVILLEKQGELGGSSVMSAGGMAFAGTDLQQRQGIADSDELLYRDLRSVGQEDNDPGVVGSYVANQLATYHWLCGHGVHFDPGIQVAGGMSVPRVHSSDPADTVRRLAAALQTSGKARLLTGKPAQRLRRDGTGRVQGLTCADGQRIAARHGVVLTCGGFGRNPALIHKFVPHYDQAVFAGGAGNQGDGLLMAWELGADFRDMAHIKGTYGKHPVDTTNTHACLCVYKGGIAVNEAAERYVDESLSYKLLGDACLRQPNACTYQIMDQAMFETGDNRDRIADFERRLEEGLLVQAGSLAELAQRLELPAGALEATVARYNALVDAGRDADFGRRHLVHEYGELRRIERAPYYGYPSTACVYGTYAGLCVDAGMRVRNVYGEAIPGLYAAGEIIGGLHGAAYMSGSALAKAAIFGRLAAHSACAD